MATLITNGNLETRAAAVHRPIGPITRVGAAPAQSPNSDIEVEFSTPFGVNVFISYDDLGRRSAYEPIIAGQIKNLIASRSLYIAAKAVVANYESVKAGRDSSGGMEGAVVTNAELQNYVDALSIPLILAGADFRNPEVDAPIASFTQSSSLVSTDWIMNVTNTSTGGPVLFYVWEVANVVRAVGADPADFNLGALAGANTVRLYAVGLGGTSEFALSVTRPT